MYAGDWCVFCYAFCLILHARRRILDLVCHVARGSGRAGGFAEDVGSVGVAGEAEFEFAWCVAAAVVVDAVLSTGEGRWRRRGESLNGSVQSKRERIAKLKQQNPTSAKAKLLPLWSVRLDNLMLQRRDCGAMFCRGHDVYAFRDAAEVRDTFFGM